MSGILDNKLRIIDAILTVEGRRQIAQGTFKVSHATFTDLGVAYIPDSEFGHDDPTTKIYFEACNLPQDQITFEANDEGKLVPFRSQEIRVTNAGGNIPSLASQGVLKDGRITAYQHYHGRRVKTSFINQVASDYNNGFTYSDISGITGSILINPSLGSGLITTAGPPYRAYIGTNGGLDPYLFAQTISGAIASLSMLGGPQISTTVSNESVYFVSEETLTGLQIFATGTLSAPLLIEESAIGGNLLTDEIENATFSSQITGILTSSFDNFLDLQTISSIDRLFVDDKFELSMNEISFDISKNSSKVLLALSAAPPRLNSIESIFSDSKLSHLDNFMYLPPIVKTSDSTVTDKTKIENLTPYLLGDYPSWGNNETKLTYSKLITELADYQDIQTPIVFSETSRKNRLIAQIFEVNGATNTVSKLDVIDFGDVMNDTQEAAAITNRVFFAGKVFLDSRGTTCYVNMFTFIFSKDMRDITGV